MSLFFVGSLKLLGVAVPNHHWRSRIRDHATNVELGSKMIVSAVFVKTVTVAIVATTVFVVTADMTHWRRKKFSYMVGV